MIKELKVAVEKGQKVSVKTVDGEIIVGTPEFTTMQGKAKIRNKEGVIYLPYNQIEHLMRVILFQ